MRLDINKILLPETSRGDRRLGREGGSILSFGIFVLWICLFIFCSLKGKALFGKGCAGGGVMVLFGSRHLWFFSWGRALILFWGWFLGLFLFSGGFSFLGDRGSSRGWFLGDLVLLWG